MTEVVRGGGSADLCLNSYYNTALAQTCRKNATVAAGLSLRQSAYIKESNSKEVYISFIQYFISFALYAYIHPYIIIQCHSGELLEKCINVYLSYIKQISVLSYVFS